MQGMQTLTSKHLDDVALPLPLAKGGSYNHFAGKDAARAFVTGCFKSHSTYDLRGLSEKEHEVSWDGCLDRFKMSFVHRIERKGRVTI